MGKTNYSVARVVTYTKQSIGKAERHNERKNQTYSNMNVDLEQTKNNVYYKTCNTTYNERLKELVYTGKVSLRGLKDNAKIFDELILDINSDYFEKHGGYDFAKKFYEEALEDIKSAIEKNQTDYISWGLMGKLYLFGISEFSNVVDVSAFRYVLPYEFICVFDGSFLP